MSENKYVPVEDLSDEKLYDLMNLNDRIKKGDLRLHRGYVVNVAFDSKSRVVAVGRAGHDTSSAYFKAILRGCNCPVVIQGFYVNKEDIDNHNLLLDKSLEKRAKEDLERKTKKSA